MKKMINVMLALCLILALLPAMAMPAQAAETNPGKALQNVFYYDAASQEVLDDSESTGILVSSGESNLLITVLPSRESEQIYTFFTTENGSVKLGVFNQAWNGSFYIYVAEESLGEAEGFTPQGIVTEGETVTVVMGWDQDGNKVSGTTTATGYENGQILLQESAGKRDYPVPVLNSKGQVCAVYYEETCYSLGTDEETFYSNSGASGDSDDSGDSSGDASQENVEEKSEKASFHVELPDPEKLRDEAVGGKEQSNVGIIAICAVGAAAAALLVAVVIAARKKKNEKTLFEAYEGTKLVEEQADTLLRLQFRSGKRIAVRRSFTIGRAPDNDVVIPKESGSVSGHHCEILVREGTAYLRDSGSTNGTFVNGHRAPAGQLVQLQVGMRVSLGGANSPESFQVVLSSKA